MQVVALGFLLMTVEKGFSEKNYVPSVSLWAENKKMWPILPANSTCKCQCNKCKHLCIVVDDFFIFLRWNELFS